jgi:hypothetical protein
MPLESSFLADALDVFMSLRSSTTSLHKKPATAECLGWIVAMDKFRTMDGLQRGQFDELAIKTLGSLTKTSEDREAAYKVIEAWRDETRARSEV